MESLVKITYVSHACLLLEIDGVRILTDPWLIGPCWANNIWQYPPPKISPKDIHSIDYIYISHGHEDHLHAETLKEINTEIKSLAITIAPDFGKPYFEKALLANGLINLKFIKHGQNITFNNKVIATMFINDTGDDDSSLLLETFAGNIFLQTDNLMSEKLAQEIGDKYEIDLAFIMTSRTGIYPGFYEYEAKKLKELSYRKSKKSYEIAINILRKIKAKYVAPYATDLCYLGEFYYMNYFHIKSKKEFIDYIEENNLNIQSLLLGPSDEIQLKSKKVSLVKISEHDFDGIDLPSYGYEKRHEVYKYQMQERKYLEKDLEEDINIFIDKFNIASEKWTEDKFNVIWKIDSIKLGLIKLVHSLPGKMYLQKEDFPQEYDLEIYIHADRIQRLVRGDYKMGLMTLHNGVAYCNRGGKEEYSELESYFWKWAYLESRFNARSKN